MAQVSLFTVWYWKCRCGWYTKAWTELGVRGSTAHHLIFDCYLRPSDEVVWWPDPGRRIWAFNVRSVQDREDVRMLRDLGPTFQ